MRKELTQKQINFISEYISNGGNKVQAALKAYDTKNYKSATKIADDNFQNPIIRDRITQSLADNNIGVDSIAHLIHEGLNSRLIVYDKLSKSYVRTNLPDYNNIHKHLEMVIEVLGFNRGKN